MDLTIAIVGALIPALIAATGWIVKHFLGESTAAIEAKKLKTVEEVAQKRLLKQDLSTVLKLINVARRTKLTYSSSRTQDHGKAVASARANLKNFVHDHPQLRDRLWQLVQSYDDALANPHCSDPNIQFCMLDDEVRRWLTELVI